MSYELNQPCFDSTSKSSMCQDTDFFFFWHGGGLESPLEHSGVPIRPEDFHESTCLNRDDDLLTDSPALANQRCCFAGFP